MNQNFKKGICVLLLCVFCLSVFAGCGPREFVKTEEPPTEAESAVSSEPDSTEPQTDAPQSLFPFAPYIKMGMTLAETQAAIGQVREVTVREGRKNFSENFSGAFIHFATDKSVIFMYSAESDLLEQLQFRCNTPSDGLNTAEAVALFDTRYGKQALHKGNYRNHIWKKDNVYILLSEIDIDNYTVTYTEAGYFEQEYTEEAEAYRRAV